MHSLLYVHLPFEKQSSHLAVWSIDIGGNTVAMIYTVKYILTTIHIDLAFFWSKQSSFGIPLPCPFSIFRPCVMKLGSVHAGFPFLIRSSFPSSNILDLISYCYVLYRGSYSSHCFIFWRIVSKLANITTWVSCMWGGVSFKQILILLSCYL